LGILFAEKISDPRYTQRILETSSNEFGLRIKKIRSDNGTEFKNSQIEGFLEDEGIKHEFSSPYTPQQNGVVERKNRTLLDMARTMLDEYKTPDRFWAEAINTAATPSTGYIFTEYSRRHHTNSSPVKSPTFHILESLEEYVLFLLKEEENLNLLLRL
jgi:transposase InsO family protein